MKRKKSEDRRSVSDLRKVRTLTKYGIVCMAILYGVHNVMVLLGIDHPIFHLAGIVFSCAIGWKLSTLFRLCATHRLCVLYACTSLAATEHICHNEATKLTEALQVTLVVCGIFLSLMLLTICVAKTN